MSKRYEITYLKDLGDERGGLGVIEGNAQIPFEIKRVFYDFNTDDDWIRGNHANMNSKFAFVSVAGSCVVDVDDGVNKESVVLDSPMKILYIDRLVWKVMRSFSKDNVLLILSDHVYDGKEYIADYDEFRHLVEEL